MGEGIKIKTNVLVDLNINSEVKQNCQIKKLTEGIELTKEEALGDMIAERWKLEPILKDKGISFEEFLKTLK